LKDRRGYFDSLKNKTELRKKFKKKYYQENKIRLRRESLQRYYQKTKENE